jgi:DNA end-binding protein Ku
MRAYWKGHLRLSLVTIAVELHAATKAASRLELHQIDKKTGKRIRYLKTVAGGGTVPQENIVKGFELNSGKHVILTPAELDKIKLETKHTIDLVQFADQCDIDPRYFERPYYLVPADGIAAEGYTVIRDALRASKKAGIGQMTIRGKESLVAVKPCGEGLLLENMRYPEELKKSDAAFEKIPDVDPEKELVQLAKELIKRKSGPFNPAAFKDHYGEALRKLVEEKRKHGKITAQEEEEPVPKGNVIDLMDALRKSIGKKSARRAKTAKPARRRHARG